MTTKEQEITLPRAFTADEFNALITTYMYNKKMKQMIIKAPKNKDEFIEMYLTFHQCMDEEGVYFKIKLNKKTLIARKKK